MPDDNPLDAPWLVLEHATEPGEMTTLTAGGDKYALVWTAPEGAAAFLAGMADAAGLRVATLGTWVLKEAYLSAAGALGAARVMFDYRPGLHEARSAPLEGLRAYCLARVGGGGRAVH